MQSPLSITHTVKATSLPENPFYIYKARCCEQDGCICFMHVSALVDYKHINDESIQEIEAILKSVQSVVQWCIHYANSIHTAEQDIHISYITYIIYNIYHI